MVVARIRSRLCGFEAWRLFPPFRFVDRKGGQSREAAKKATMTRFAPAALSEFLAANPVPVGALPVRDGKSAVGIGHTGSGEVGCHVETST